ncbi:paraneoplastic antigen Ma1 homolog [Myxocyprinus asiaticus]|uniref:paraneoplastic antigen Ma1 homolog n=1 Tax=Myxocyprinus asiaticus TaxID=70543 RepID=UPI00222252DA|nr:paraneoplastic antigen Ma1 homolog [Myxocyprinus asiaticus]
MQNMSVSHSKTLQSELSSWCREEGIDKTHAVLLTGVPTETEAAFIEEVAQKVKVFGRVRVRDTRLGPKPHTLMILCECRGVVDPSSALTELPPVQGAAPWKVVMTSKNDSPTDPNKFTAKLSLFLSGDGKSLTDVQALLTLSSPDPCSPEAIIRAMGKVLNKVHKSSSDGTAYRKLRTFSGLIPTPQGDENVEGWIDQAWMMIQECECSDKEKRRRIIESLKGPTLEIIKAVQFSSLDANSLQYLEAL